MENEVADVEKDPSRGMFEGVWNPDKAHKGYAWSLQRSDFRRWTGSNHLNI